MIALPALSDPCSCIFNSRLYAAVQLFCDMQKEVGEAPTSAIATIIKSYPDSATVLALWTSELGRDGITF